MVKNRSAKTHIRSLTPAMISGVVEAAWCDKTSFTMIEQDYGLTEAEVIALMRTHLKSTSFKLWRKRVYGRKFTGRTTSRHGDISESG